MIDAPEDTRETAHDIALQFCADLEQLYVVRALAGVIATRMGFDLDGVEDVRLAIDEVSTRLIALAEDGAEITCTFKPSGDGLAVEVTCPNTAPGLPNDRSFGWHVVKTLTDSLEASQDANTHRNSSTKETFTTTIRFLKRKDSIPQ
jgi:serine/threonine-protein kinase RsbW